MGQRKSGSRGRKFPIGVQGQSPGGGVGARWRHAEYSTDQIHRSSQIAYYSESDYTLKKFPTTTGGHTPMSPCRYLALLAVDRYRQLSQHTNHCAVVKSLKKVLIALCRNPSQSYGSSLAIWYHTVLPATECHRTQVNTPRLNPSQLGRW